MPSQNFYVGFCDTYIDNIRCKIFYPSQNNKKYASKSNDLRKTKASKKNNSISILLVRYWCEVHFKKICRIFAWPMFIKFYDWLWNRNTDDPNGFQANNYFKFDVWNRSVPYEIETSLNGLDTLDFSCPNDSSTSSNPTPDQELLSSMLKDTSTKKVIIYHGGVGTSIDYYYTKFCQRISKELNALVVIPEFSCGTLLYRVDRKNKKIQHYSYEIPMYTNNQERKDQNDIRSTETYRVTKVLQDIMKNVNQRVIPTDVIGHSLGGGSAIHLLANQEENDRKVFEKIVGLGPSLGVGMTDLDWKNVLEMKYDTKVLQILENLYYYKDFPNNAICARLGVADQNYGNFKKQKQFIVTINKCNHCDIFDLSCRPLNKYSWWEKKQWGVAGLLPDDPLISFENQIFLTCSFLDGADINELVSFENQDWFVDGVTLKDKLDMQKVQNSVNSLPPFLLTYNLLIINPDKTNLLKQIQKRRNTRPEDEQEDGDLDFPIEDEKIFKDADQIQIPKEVISTRDKSSSPERDHNDDQTRQISISNNKFYQKETDFTDYPKLVNSRLGNFEPEPIPIIDRKTGPGEYGKELILGGSILTADRVQASIAEYGFNIVASDQISLDRNPADLRHDECKHWDYPNVMDIARHDVAVILVFHNEAFSTLVRTVHSVFNQSPPELLREIIMIDDGSNKQDLGDKLEEYVNLPKWHGKVKLFRNSERHGLIRARCDGARKASAEILVYLDAHCEAGPNWLLPLIMPIIKDRKACTCPLVDVIDGNKYTFTAQAGGDSDGFARGAWDWDLLWKRVPLTHREKAKRSYTTEPYASPAMAGGLFAINKDWFFEMGLYDEELEIWGGENFELSYKLWMCGGKLLFVPCSRVGHIYRLPGWRGNPPQKSVHANFAMRNYRRVIDTWWDGYAKYFYERRPEAKRVDAGDLTVPRSIRTKLQCKSFEWFMTEIAYDIPLRYPLVVPDNGAEGSLKLKHESYNEKCLDARNGAQGREIKLSPCSERRQYSGPKSMLTWHEDIRAGNNKNDINERKLCLDCTGIDKAITLWECHGQGGNQLFKFHPEKNRLIHAISDGCVTGDVEKGLLYVRRCEEGNIFQEWDWENVNEDQLRKFNSDAKRAVIVKEIDDI